MSNYFNEMIFEILTDDQSYDDVDVRDYRGTTELVTKNPQSFIKICDALKERGWRSNSKDEPARLIFKEEFDCSEPLSVVISLHSVSEWTKRYVDGENREPVIALTNAANLLTARSDIDMSNRMRLMISEEIKWIAENKII